jgi:hypothetical protein
MTLDCQPVPAPRPVGRNFKELEEMGGSLCDTVTARVTTGATPVTGRRLPRPGWRPVAPCPGPGRDSESLASIVSDHDGPGGHRDGVHRDSDGHPAGGPSRSSLRFPAGGGQLPGT